jgi:molybdate transport system substrate-binding protein
MLKGVLTAMLLCLYAACGTPVLAQGEVRIAVAANFQSTLEALTASYSQTHPAHFAITAGATGLLYTQIVQGAPFDLFFAADRERPLRLEQEGLAVAGTRITYAVGRLVLWAPNRKVSGDLKQVLGDPGIRTIAIANPAAAPYGKGAMEVLQSLGLTGYRIVQGESIGQTFQFLATANADAGFVARSQIRDYEKANGRSLATEILEVTPGLHAPIMQDAVLLKRAQNNSTARAFLEFVESQESRNVIQSYGYDTPPPRTEDHARH